MPDSTSSVTFETNKSSVLHINSVSGPLLIVSSSERITTSRIFVLFFVEFANIPLARVRPIKGNKNYSSNKFKTYGTPLGERSW